MKEPRGVFIGQFELGKPEIAKVQRLVEVELDPKKFSYFLDCDSVARIKLGIANNKRERTGRTDA
jgi:hypothetical protein